MQSGGKEALRWKKVRSKENREKKMRGNINIWKEIERKILWTKKEKETLKLREMFSANVGLT
jgi:hypothetical protein